MLYHSDNVEASGFVQHLKLPHYVDFQANLELLRRMRADRAAPQPAPHDLMDEAVSP
ncbi:Alpha-D-ribose 1-methylphosphonate 5-triphosphate synthase subunit PhnI [compost metagenome]